MESNDTAQLKSAKRLIYAFSIAIPLVVIVLFGIKIEGLDLSFLPPIYASINGLTAFVLIAALIAVKSKKMELHKGLMRFALLLSLLFLGCYVAYHMASSSTAYLGDYGSIYYPLLIAHILLSIVVVPLVLFTYLFAWQEDFVKHKKWTRISFPIWLFVAISGVVVYLMISPYY